MYLISENEINKRYNDVFRELHALNILGDAIHSKIICPYKATYAVIIEMLKKEVSAQKSSK